MRCVRCSFTIDQHLPDLKNGACAYPQARIAAQTEAGRALVAASVDGATVFVNPAYVAATAEPDPVPEPEAGLEDPVSEPAPPEPPPLKFFKLP